MKAIGRFIKSSKTSMYMLSNSNHCSSLPNVWVKRDKIDEQNA